MMKYLKIIFLCLPLFFGYEANAQCDASFTVSPAANICANTPVTFLAATGSPQASFQWSFGGGATPASSTADSVVVTFPYNNGVLTSHTVTLIVTDTIGGIAQSCTTSQTIDIQPHTQILITDNVNFKRCVANLAAATNYTNTYTITPPASGTFIWSFGGSIPSVTSSVLTQTATYGSFGSFPLTVTKQGETCPGYTGKFQYYTNPIAGLLIQGGSSFVCEGTPLTVSNTSSQSGGVVDYYTWSWGDGTPTYNTATAAAQTHTFDLTQMMPPVVPCNIPSGGAFSFNVTVTAVNACFSHFNTSPILVGPKPRALLLPSDTVKCLNGGTASISFLNQSCPTDDDWQWTFSSGSGSSATNPSYTYTTPGQYHVQLIATDPGGCGADTATADITILDVATVSATFTGDTSGCAPLAVSFTNTSVPLTGVGYLWSVSPNTGFVFTGGTSTTSLNPNITFTVPGTYTVSLAGTNNCGTRTWSQVFKVFEKPTVSLAPVPNTCAPYTANPFSLATINLNGTPATNYAWTFTGGSPATSNVQNPGNVTFGNAITEPTAMDISLSISNICGTVSANTGFVATPPPTISVSYTGNGVPNQSVGCQPFQAQITNVVTPSSGVTFTWTVTPATGWVFTGGTSATSKSPGILFTQDGVYTVSLTASNGCVPNEAWSQMFTIKDKPVLALPPIADQCGNSFSYNPATGMSVNWHQGTTQTYAWTFTGGTPATDNTAAPGMVTFSPGPCAVKLVVENECGKDSVTQAFTLTPPPTAAVTFTGNGVADEDTGCVSFQVNITNVVTPATGVTFTWTVTPATGWSFAGGTSATSKEPQIMFTTHGSYSLSLTATNGCAPDVLWTHAFFVKDKPSVSLPPITAPCGQLTYTANPSYFTNGTPITGYAWTFATGIPATDNVAMPGAVVFGPGAHTVTVDATNECGTTTAQQAFTVDPPVTPVIGAAPAAICVNAAAITLTAAPTGGTWSGAGMNAVTGVFSPASAGVGIKNAIYTYGTGFCLRRDTAVILVNALPTPDAGPDMTVCQRSPAIALSGAPAGGTWTGGVTAFNPINTGSFTLGYFYTDPATGCSKTDNRTFFVLPSPTVTMQAPPTYCVTANNITLTGYSPLNGMGGTGVWSGNGIVDPAAGIFNSSLTGAGVTTLKYTFSNMFGCPDSDSVAVTVILPQTPDAGPAQAICRNIPSLTLNATPAGGSWSGLNLTSGGVFSPATAPAGTHDMVYTVGTGTCLVTDTTVVTVKDTTTLSMGGQNAVCTGNPPFLLNGYSPAGGIWSGIGVTDPATGLVDPALWPSGTPITLTYTLLNAAGCTSTNPKSGLRRPLPVVSAGNDTSYCATLSILNLPTPSPAGGTWSGPAGIVNASTGTIQPSIPGAGNYTAYYTFTDGFGCTNLDSNQLTITALTTVAAGVDDSTCINSGLFALTASPVGGVWSGAGVTGANFNPMTAGVGSYPLTYTVGAGVCAVSDGRQMTVKDTTTLNMGPLSDACTGDPAFLLSGYSPTGGIWSGIGVTNPATGLVDPALWPSGTPVTLTYTLLNAAGCTATHSKPGLRRPLPTVLAGDDTTYCATSSILHLPAPSPAGGTWSGPAGIVNASTGTIQPSATGIGNYTTYYTFTDGFGCTNLDSAQITITALPIVGAGTDSILCINTGSIALSASPAGGVWSGAGVSGTIFNPLLAGNGVHSLAYTVGSGVCAVSDIRQITVLDSGGVSAGPPVSVCVGNTPLLLNGMIPLGGVWTGTGITNPVGIFDPALIPVGTSTVRYTVTQPNGCSAAGVRQVVKHPLPIINAGPDSTFCLTTAVQTLIPATPAGGTWSGTGITNGAGGQFTPSVAGLGTFNATYTYTDGNGCTNTDVTQIQVIAPVAIDAGTNQQVCVNQGTVALTGYFPTSGGSWSGTSLTSGGVFDPAAAGTGAFTLTYTTGAGSCLVSDTKQMTVVPAPVVDAGPLLNACATDPLLSLSTGTPAGGVWIGPGVSGGTNFSAPVAGVGTFTLNYTYTDANGCTNNDTTALTVHPLPLVSFTSQPNTCRDTAALFQSTGSNIAAYTWKFGDGGTSSIAAPMHAFPDTGWYTVRLVGTSAAGCRDSADAQIYITDLPTPLFSPSADTGCATLQANGVWGLPVALADQSIPWAAPYQWVFGNGQTSNLPQPDTILLPQGRADTTYNVTLTMTNNCGTRTYVRPITVFPSPQVDFGPNVPSGCSPLAITFANLTTGIPTQFLWDFGNGNTSTDSLPPIQKFLTDSLDTTYTIRLIALNHCGSDTSYATVTVFPNTVDAFFTIDTLFGCVPLTVQVANLAGGATNVSYDFGDGAQMATPNGAHTFTQPGLYLVQQFADNGCSYDTARKQVRVFPSPTADFSAQAVLCEDMPASFTSISANITGQHWDFGDGTTVNDTSSLPNPAYAYPEPGSYVVTLTVTSDSNACQTVVTHPVTVRPAPITAINPTVSAGCAPLTVGFGNASAGTFHYWLFGDSSNSVAASPIHTFTTPGLYGVRYTTTTTEGCENDTLVPILVKETPVVNIGASQTHSCDLPVTVNFSAAATGTGLVYGWTFGDGGTASTANPSHMFTRQDTFLVQVIVTNAFLCADTAIRPFIVYPQPTAVFSGLPTTGCAPLSVQFTAPDSSATDWVWDFGDGDSAFTQAPSHVYPVPGSYGVSLIASVNGFCPDTLNLSSYVTVYPVPVADFVYTPEVGNPSDGTISFTNRSLFAVRYFWAFGDGDTSTQVNPTHRYYANDSFPVMLIAYNAFGCPDTVILPAVPDIFGGLQIPNAFAPFSGNGDAAFFKPVGVGLKEFEIEVFTPWGDKVWSSDKLENGRPAEAWDGTDKKGVPVSSDAFLWKVTKAKFTNGREWEGMTYGRIGEKPSRTGTVTVVR